MVPGPADRRAHRPLNGPGIRVRDEFALWVLFTVAVLAALVLRPVGTGNALLHGFLIYVALMSWSRASRYLDRASVEQPMRQRITWFLLAPLVGFLHVFVPIPIRLWSVATSTP